MSPLVWKSKYSIIFYAVCDCFVVDKGMSTAATCISLWPLDFSWFVTDEITAIISLWPFGHFMVSCYWWKNCYYIPVTFGVFLVCYWWNNWWNNCNYFPVTFGLFMVCLYWWNNCNYFPVTFGLFMVSCYWWKLEC